MKKIILGVIIVIIIVMIGFAIWYTLSMDWYDNTHKTYNNTEFDYAFQYHPDWYFIGDSTSDIIQLYSIEQEPADGGVPLGSKIEVIVLENYDNLNLQKWVEQMTTQETNSEEIISETIKMATGQEALQLTGMPGEGLVVEGPPVSIYLTKNNHVIMISYMGREPDYSANRNEFEWLLSSFHFED